MNVGLATSALSRIPFQECFPGINEPPLYPVFEIQWTFLRNKQRASCNPDSNEFAQGTILKI
ncbi:MAG: hypothetical protein NTW74_17295 [Acidobacteria bacterium]|nr:hypothetical protein [Acidobacteriota bacterium]